MGWAGSKGAWAVYQGTYSQDFLPRRLRHLKIAVQEESKMLWPMLPSLSRAKATVHLKIALNWALCFLLVCTTTLTTGCLAHYSWLPARQAAPYMDLQILNPDRCNVEPAIGQAEWRTQYGPVACVFPHR